ASSEPGLSFPEAADNPVVEAVNGAAVGGGGPVDGLDKDWIKASRKGLHLDPHGQAGEKLQSVLEQGQRLPVGKPDAAQSSPVRLTDEAHAGDRGVVMNDQLAVP